MSLKSIFFDFDGTLADTDPVHRAIFAEMLSPQGIIVDEVYFRKHIAGGSNREIFKRFFPGLSDAEADNMSEKKEADFRQRAAKNLKPIAGVDRALSWAKTQNLPLVLVTNAPRSNINHLLPLLGLDKSFDLQITGDDVKRGKPHPDPYLLALEKMNLKPIEAIVFEDSRTGITAAKGAGIFTFGLTTSHPAEELKQAGADAIIADYHDEVLWHILEQRF